MDDHPYWRYFQVSIPSSCLNSTLFFRHLNSSYHVGPSMEGDVWRDFRNSFGSLRSCPGVLIVEGEARNVAEYVKRIQRLRWQAMQIRGEEIENMAEGQELGSLRRFPVGIKELPESGMSELAASCRHVNLEQLFLTALKITK
ncbi:hypothetical protein R1sor_023139 [Riccia sorocarpa]|uniref:Uncharacterized protein n=1 Tax=Riccia sorocarpa TaxID=122646 RepID=A0ABD3GML2_9MARC